MKEKGGETEEEIIRRRVFSNLKNSSLQQSLKLVPIYLWIICIVREENCPPKSSRLKYSLKLILLFVPVKIPYKLCNLKYYFTFVPLLISAVITIQLLKQSWFLLVTKDSQTKDSSAN